MSISAIVCAYNEEKTIRPIVQTLLDHPRINEVIMVDDGSTDRTWTTVVSIKHPKLTPLRHQKNLGKGAAIVSAVQRSHGDILLFIDADLKHFLPQHVDLLVLPLEIDPHSMAIGVRETPRVIDKTLQILMKPFGGERALPKQDILPLLKKISVSGYGVETILNLAFIRKKRRIHYVTLPRLIHLFKSEKWAMSDAIKEIWKESNHLVQQLFDLENYAQPPSLQPLLRKLRQLTS